MELVIESKRETLGSNNFWTFSPEDHSHSPTRSCCHVQLKLCIKTAEYLELPLYQYRVIDDVDCWYLDQESTIALKENIKSGDKRDCNSQTGKHCLRYVLHYTRRDSFTHETFQFGLSEEVAHMDIWTLM